MENHISNIPNAASTQTPENKYSKVKKHWHILAIESHYVRKHEDDKNTFHAQRMNIMVQEREKNIDARIMAEIRSAVGSRMLEQYGVAFENIADYIILNISYMGYMSEYEYFTGRKFKPSKNKA